MSPSSHISQRTFTHDAYQHLKPRTITVVGVTQYQYLLYAY